MWPVILGYDETSRVLIAWCELRQGIRHFRTDRVIKAEALTELNGLRPSELRRRWQVWREANHQTRELPTAAVGASILSRTRRRCCSKLPLFSDDRLIGFGASQAGIGRGLGQSLPCHEGELLAQAEYGLFDGVPGEHGEQNDRRH